MSEEGKQYSKIFKCEKKRDLKYKNKQQPVVKTKKEKSMVRSRNHRKRK